VLAGSVATIVLVDGEQRIVAAIGVGGHVSPLVCATSSLGARTGRQ
jgi:hypothetical protein